MSKDRLFIAYWDCMGFEAIVDCTTWERQALLDEIAGKQLKPAPINLHAMMLRARFNPQRSPEIWSFTATEELKESDIRQVAQDDPQHLVDLIRNRGKCLYRNPTNKSVIT